MTNHEPTPGPPSDSFITLDARLKARKTYGFVILFIVLQMLIAAMWINVQRTDGWLIGCPTPTHTPTHAP